MNMALLNVLHELPFANIDDNDLLEIERNESVTNARETDFLDVVNNRYVSVDDVSTFFSDIDPDINLKLKNDINIIELGYISETKFKEDMHTWRNMKSNISLFYMNARSLTKHLEEISILIQNQTFKFTFLCFTETWINNETIDLSSIEDYIDVHSYRKTKKGGGVGIYISDKINFSVLDNLTYSSKHIESIFIRIDKEELKSIKDIIVGCVYRPPDGDCNLFMECYQDVLDTIGLLDCFICGDFNIDIGTENNKSEQFLNTNISSNFTPIITKPTRTQKTSKTVIDNILTNKPSLIDRSGIVLSDISDHYPLYITTHYEHQRKFNTQSKHMSNKFNIGQFIESMNMVDWTPILHVHDTEAAYNSMHQIITKNYKDAVSSKFTNNSRYNNHLPWVTETLKGLIKQKNKLYIKTKKSDLDADKQAYKQCKRIVNREMKCARRQYYNKALAENKDNLSKYWSIMKEIIGKRRAEENPSYFLDESGERNEDCMEIATNFNKYFINVGPQLASKIPETSEDCTHYLQHRNDYTIFLEPVIIEETRKIIMALRDASAGWDCINKLMLINTLDCIVVPLTHILNLSITQGIFPSKLKVAKIKPIYKAESKHKYNNYRPISILTAISKVFERVLYNRFVSFFNKHNLFYEKQFGFRTQHSTELAVNTLVHALTQAKEENLITLGIFLDFSKAFDTVNFNIL